MPLAAKRLRALFDEFAELSGELRTAALSRLANEEAELASALSSLFQADHTQTGAVLKQTGVLSSQVGSSLPKIEGYQVLSLLGYGGMGEVYLAERVRQNVRQKVAIKRWRALPHHSSKLAARLLLEQKTLAELDHPNIVRWIDAGLDADQCSWFAMDYVEGLPLIEYVTKHQSTLPACLALFEQVLAAVEHAHQRGVIHRDLKGANILVDDFGKVYVLDFGIAKLIEHSDHETATAERFFSLQIAAPEQLMGKPTSTATDIYALGVLLYRLLSDHEALPLLGKSPKEIQALVCDVMPPAPSSVVDSKRRRALRGELDRICLQALRKAPNERYPSAEKFRSDLDAYHKGLPIWAAGASRWYRSQKFIRRHWLVLSAASVIGVSLSALSIGLLISRSALLQSRNSAQAQAKRAETLNAFLLDTFRQADLGETDGKKLTLDEVLDRAIIRIADDHSADADALRFQFAQAKLATEDYLALPALIKQLNSSEFPSSKLNALVVLGEQAFALGKFAESAQHYLAASQQTLFAQPNQQPGLEFGYGVSATVAQNSLLLRHWQARYFAGEQQLALTKVSEILRIHAGASWTIEDALVIAKVFASHDAALALSVLESSLKQLDDNKLPYNSAAALAERHRAELFRQQGDYGAALKAIERPLQFAQKVYGEHSAMATYMLETRGMTRFKLQDFDQAYLDMRAVAESRRIRYGEMHGQYKGIRINSLIAGLKSKTYRVEARQGLSELYAQESGVGSKIAMALPLGMDAVRGGETALAQLYFRFARSYLKPGDRHFAWSVVGLASSCAPEVSKAELEAARAILLTLPTVAQQPQLAWADQAVIKWGDISPCERVKHF